MELYLRVLTGGSDPPRPLRPSCCSTGHFPRSAFTRPTTADLCLQELYLSTPGRCSSAVNQARRTIRTAQTRLEYSEPNAVLDELEDILEMLEQTSAHRERPDHRILLSPRGPPTALGQRGGDVSNVARHRATDGSPRHGLQLRRVRGDLLLQRGTHDPAHDARTSRSARRVIARHNPGRAVNVSATISARSSRRSTFTSPHDRFLEVVATATIKTLAEMVHEQNMTLKDLNSPPSLARPLRPNISRRHLTGRPRMRQRS